MTDKLKNLMKKNGVQTLKKLDPVADLNSKLDAIMRYQGLTVRQIADGVYEVIKHTPQTGGYLNPIPWQPGDAVTAGLWYYMDDKELPHEAIQSGVPADFYDHTYFDFVEDT